MKFFIIAALALSSLLAHASEVTIFEADFTRSSLFPNFAHASFQVDKTTGEGFVQVVVTEERPGIPSGHYDHMGRWTPYNQTMTFVVLDEKVKVDNLMLMGNKIVYHAEEGEVECGTLGVSRVLKRPTIYLSGKCELTAFVEGFQTERHVVVKLKTK